MTECDRHQLFRICNLTLTHTQLILSQWQAIKNAKSKQIRAGFIHLHINRWKKY